MKIAINVCYGGFSLSEAATRWLSARGFSPAVEYLEWVKNEENPHYFVGCFHIEDSERNNPLLIECLETLGLKESSGSYAAIRIIEIPDDVDWEIEEYDGMESVRERSRRWN